MQSAQLAHRGAIGAAALYGGVPARASEVNSETEFALATWGIDLSRIRPVEQLLEEGLMQQLLVRSGEDVEDEELEALERSWMRSCEQLDVEQLEELDAQCRVLKLKLKALRQGGGGDIFGGGGGWYASGG